MMDTDRMTRSRRRRLARWQQEEGTMTVEQRMRLTHWRRRDRQARLAAAVGARPAPVWCLVANVVAERRAGPGGMDVRRGTKHFAPGAKVYCLPPLWDSYHKVRGFDKIVVVGRHRRSHRYMTIVTRTEWLTNWRVQLVYSPPVIREMVRFVQDRWSWLDYTIDYLRANNLVWDGSAESKARAEQLAARMRA